MKLNIATGIVLSMVLFFGDRGNAQSSAPVVRAIPVPTTVSPALQALLARNATTTARPPLPTTNEGWLRFLGDPADQHKRTQALLSRFNVSMTKEVIGGVNCFVIAPPNVAPADRNRLLVHLHGGGYLIGAGEGGTVEGILLAAAARIPVVAIDYRMPPDHPYPAAMDDAMSVWRVLIKEHRPSDMAIFGTSTGGGMALLMVQRARAEGLPLPAAVIAGAPWSDLSKTGDSYYVNEISPVPFYDGLLSVAAKLYANGMDLKDPRLSPVYGSFSNFPPTLLLTGTRDVFLSNTVRVQRKLLDAGVPTDLLVYEGQSHAAYLVPDIPESAVAFNDMTKFLDEYLRKEKH
jgi:acetyl esterase/lipase